MNDKKAAIPSVAVFFVFINLSKKSLYWNAACIRYRLFLSYDFLL